MRYSLHREDLSEHDGYHVLLCFVCIRDMEFVFFNEYTEARPSVELFLDTLQPCGHSRVISRDQWRFRGFHDAYQLDDVVDTSWH